MTKQIQFKTTAGKKETSSLSRAQIRHGLSNGFRIALIDTSLSVSAFISENKTNNSPAAVLQSLLNTTTNYCKDDLDIYKHVQFVPIDCRHRASTLSRYLI